MQVPISQLTGAVILNPVQRSNVVGAASSEVSFDAESHSPTAPNGPTNGATSTAEQLPNSEILQLKSGKVVLPELPPPPPPPPPPPLPPTRRHCQKYYFGGGEGEMQRGRGFSNCIVNQGTSCHFNYSARDNFFNFFLKTLRDSLKLDKIHPTFCAEKFTDTQESGCGMDTSRVVFCEILPNSRHQSRRCQMERHHRERGARRSKGQRTERGPEP